MRKIVLAMIVFIPGLVLAQMPPEVLKAAADEVNKQAGSMIDKDTRLDSASGVNNTLRYNYTMVNVAAAEVDSQQFSNIIKPMLVGSTCQQMKIFYSNGVKVVFSYKGKGGKSISTVTISPKDCGYS